MMKTGRNDPCPCGSGKKYKVCCLQKDQHLREKENQVRRMGAPSPQLPLDATPAAAPPIASEPDDAIIELYNAFEAADFEEQLRLFDESLDNPKLMDAENIYSMFNHLEGESRRRHEPERVLALAKAIRERRPDALRQDAVYFLSSVLLTMLELGATDDLAATAHEFAAAATDSAELFSGPFEAVEYYGYLDIALDMARTLWSKIKERTDFFAWALAEHAQQAIKLELYAYCTENAAPRPDDAAFISRMREDFKNIDEAWLKRAIVHLTGPATNWLPAQFALLQPQAARKKKHDKELPREATENLVNLSFEFVAQLHRTAGMPYTKAELARDNLVEYLLRRASNEITPRNLPVDRQDNPRSANRVEAPHQPLCPDRSSLESYLADLTAAVSYRNHAIAAAMELLPAWLQILESRQLLSAEEHRAALDHLRPLIRKVVHFFKGLPDAPGLAQAVDQAWSDARSPAHAQG